MTLDIIIGVILMVVFTLFITDDPAAPQRAEGERVGGNCGEAESVSMQEQQSNC